MINEEALALAAKIVKVHGEGACVLASDMHVARRFPTGSITLDIALGGGWPGNHWVEVIGRESHGKTAIVLKTVATNQALDPNFTVLWIAAEHYDVDQAEALGVDNSRVIVVPTQAMEHAYQTMIEFATSRSVDCIVLDSYPALIADEESVKAMDESAMTLGARLTGKFFRKAGKATRRGPDDRPILGIVINQFRDKIGAFSPRGTPQTSPGGHGKNYAFYVRVEVRRDDWIVEKRPGKGEIKVGQVIKAITIKNKAAAPQQVAVVDFYFRDAPSLNFKRGEFDTVKELFTMGVLLDVVTRRGAYFTFGENKWLGKEAMVAALREDVGLNASLTEAVREASHHIDAAKVPTEADLNEALSAGKRRVARARAAEAA